MRKNKKSNKISDIFNQIFCFLADGTNHLCDVLEGLEIPAPPDGAGSIQVQFSFQKTW
ncbi:MAG: hypothetical protein K8S24_02415 [Candidatus Aegiribacteria sp.]|nr:hypothetical protein [Candidatus Aegiribacteria sp.]